MAKSRDAVAKSTAKKQTETEEPVVSRGVTRPSATGRATARPAVQKKTSRWAAVKPRGAKPPMPVVGTYLLRVDATGPGEKDDVESFKIWLTVKEIFDGGEDKDLGISHKIGDQVFTVYLVTGPGARPGRERTMAFVMAAAGFEEHEQYLEFDPDGDFIETCLGKDTEYSENDMTIVGRFVWCRVTRGRPDGKGGYYREYEWAVWDEEDQVVPTLAA